MRSDIRVCSLSPHGLHLHHIGEGIIVWAERRKNFLPFYTTNITTRYERHYGREDEKWD